MMHPPHLTHVKLLPVSTCSSCGTGGSPIDNFARKSGGSRLGVRWEIVESLSLVMYNFELFWDLCRTSFKINGREGLESVGVE